MSDYRKRLNRLVEVWKADAEPAQAIVYRDGRKERTTAHKAIVAAVKYGPDIDHIENIDGDRVGGLTNALLGQDSRR